MYRACGVISPPILNASTSWSWVVRFIPWWLYTPGKNFSHPWRMMLAGHQNRYARFWWSRISLVPVGNGTLHCSSRIVVTTLTMLPQVLSLEKLFTHDARQQVQLRNVHNDLKGTVINGKTRKGLHILWMHNQSLLKNVSFSLPYGRDGPKIWRPQ